MLSSNGVTAFADGNRVVTTGTIESVSITDPGLTTAPVSVPAPSPIALGALVILVGIAGSFLLRRRPIA